VISKNQIGNIMKLVKACGILKSTICFSAAMAVTVASAQYSTDFENPPFTSGLIAGQDSWTSTGSRTNANVRSAAEIAAELTAGGLTAGTVVHSGDQAFLLSGGDGSSTTTKIVSGLASSPQVTLDVWARPLAPRTDAPNIGNVFITMQDSAGARAAGFRFGYYDDGSGTAGPHIDYASSVTGIWQNTGLPWDPDTWYNIAMSVDYSAQRYNFYVNGSQVNVSPIPFYSGNVVNSFDRFAVFRGSSQTGMILDDISVVPEPSALAFLVACGSALLLRRRV
jgi:hypothetical protein